MRKIKYLILMCAFTLIFGLGIGVHASEWSSLSGKYVTDYSDSISNNIGNAIAETEDGYIWIGQYSGLTKYNGTKFITITEADGVNLNSVVALYADGNTLYIGTQNLLAKYENGKYSVIEIPGEESLTVNGFSMFDGVLYIATSVGLFSYNGEVSKLTDGEVVDVAVGEVGGFYIVSSNKTNTVYSIKTKKEFYSLKSIKSLYIHNKKLYMGSSSGEFIEYYMSEFHTYSLGSSTPINVFTYADELLFIGADNGTYTFNGSIVEKFKKMEVTNSIEDIHMDYQKNLWIISSSNGIVKVSSNPFEDLFLKYNIGDYLNEKLGITKTGVNGIARYNDLLYLATENCLLIVNEKTGELVHNDLEDSLMGERLRCVMTFDNKLYVGCYNSSIGLVESDGANILKKYSSTDLVVQGETSSKAGEIRCLCATSDTLFIGTNYGISALSNGAIKTVAIKRPLSLYANGSTLYACIENGGIETYGLDLTSKGKVTDTDTSTVLKCLKQDNLLLYAAQNVLSVWDESTNTTRKVHLSLTGSVVELLYIDGLYYIGTDSDIYVIEKNDLLKDDLNYLTLGKGEGLRSGLSSNASGMYDESNNIYYFASRNSAYKYNLEFNVEDEIPAKLAVSSIVVDDKTLTIYDEIKLKHNSNRITVYFDVLNYMDYDTYSIYYKLEGVDSDYNVESADSLSSISYTNLKGGKYVLTIYAKDQNGVTTENTININIVKELGFFEHTYVIVLFIIFGVLLLAAASGLTAHFMAKRAHKRQDELKKITLESIEAIARTIDAKDKYTNGHSTRVGAYSRMIAEAMGMPEDEVLNIYYIGLLHDIGKIAVPRSILNKPGRLDDEEFAKIKTHTVEGEKILSTISTIPHITEGAKYHHERYDGKGYPEGLSGTNIPFIARVICCADCFDAMATKRSYKEPYTVEKIISEFQRCSGTQFDPEIAKVVVKMLEDGILTIEEQEKGE